MYAASKKLQISHKGCNMKVKAYIRSIRNELDRLEMYLNTKVELEKFYIQSESPERIFAISHITCGSRTIGCVKAILTPKRAHVFGEYYFARGAFWDMSFKIHPKWAALALDCALDTKNLFCAAYERNMTQE